MRLNGILGNSQSDDLITLEHHLLRYSMYAGHDSEKIAEDYSQQQLKKYGLKKRSGNMKVSFQRLRKKPNFS